MIDRSDLDPALYAILLNLKDSWTPDSSLAVAAGLFDNKRGVAFGTAMHPPKNRWIHAGRHLIESADDSGFRIDPETTAVVLAFAPCLDGDADEGFCSCSDLLRSRGLKRLHVGSFEPWFCGQPDDYRRLGFDITKSTNERILRTCRLITEIYAPESGPLAGPPAPGIANNPFRYID